LIEENLYPVPFGGVDHVNDGIGFPLYGTPSMAPETRTFPVVPNDSSMLKGKIQTHACVPSLDDCMKREFLANCEMIPRG
jgi:hypothetical protein